MFLGITVSRFTTCKFRRVSSLKNMLSSTGLFAPLLDDPEKPQNVTNSLQTELKSWQPWCETIVMPIYYASTHASVSLWQTKC